MEKKVIIIGAGLAGLSAGIHARINGYQAEIFELHSIAGGVCTAWKRKNFLIDGCVHWWIGSQEGTTMNRLFKEVGIRLKPQKDDDEFARLRHSRHGEITVPRSLAEFSKILKDISKEDSVFIDELVEHCRVFSKIDSRLLPPEVQSLKENLNYLKSIQPLAKTFKRFKKTDFESFFSRFNSEKLRSLLPKIAGTPDMSILALLMTLGKFDIGDGTFPEGGSIAIAESMEKKFLELGGQIHFNSEVKKVLTKNNQAHGIRLTDNSEYFSDYVLSAADGHDTHFQFLDKKYLGKKAKKLYQNSPLFPGIVHVGIGTSMDLKGKPHSYFFADPPEIEGQQAGWFYSRHYAAFEGFAPKGKTAITIMILSDFDYWNTIYKDKSEYRRVKELYAEKSVQLLETVYPGISNTIEMTDVSTPMTWLRYTKNQRGAFEGILPTPKMLTTKIPKSVKGLKNFFLAGQWVEVGGGIPSAIKSGRHAVALICHQEKKEFVSEMD